MKIGIIIAMDKEFRRISELLDGQKREEDGGRIFVMGRLGDNELVLHQCGIGKVNAAVGVSELIVPTLCCQQVVPEEVAPTWR